MGVVTQIIDLDNTSTGGGRRRCPSLQKVTLRCACSLINALAAAPLATNFLQIHGCALTRTAARRSRPLLRYCRASRCRVESLCIAAPTPARCIRHRRRSQALPTIFSLHLPQAAVENVAFGR